MKAILSWLMMLILACVVAVQAQETPRVTPVVVKASGDDDHDSARLSLLIDSILNAERAVMAKDGPTCTDATISCNSTASGQIAATDCGENGQYIDYWLFEGTVGSEVVIDMESSEFDTVLGLIDPTHDVVTADDDGGDGTNSRITHTLSTSGTWKLAAQNLFPDNLGDYTLTLTCSGSSAVPQAPSNLEATPSAPGQITLSWQDNSGNEDEFRVEQKSGSGSFQDVGSVPADIEQAQIGTLVAGTAYSFRIRARNAAGDSAYSNEATATATDNVPCVADETTLCLNNNRFRVEVDWRDFIDDTGQGKVVPYSSDDSGLFWFFSANNWEMMVKVLNGCGFNNRYWVFSAATTNVEYTLTVTDTATGTVKTWTNPLGAAAPAVTDTDAFATCP